MGMWGGRDPRAVDLARIAEEMRPAVYKWFNGRIQIFKPTAGSTYNPLTDAATGAGVSVIYDSGVDGALIQPLRSAARVEAGGQSNDLVGIRFQTRVSLFSTVPRAGLLVRVLDGGEDPRMVNYTYSLQEAVNGSMKWGEIMEAIILVGGVAPVAS